MSATIVSYEQFQEIRQRRHARTLLPGTDPVVAPEGEYPPDQRVTIICEALAVEPSPLKDDTAQR